MFICGSGSFGHEEEHDHHEAYSSPCRTPKRSSKRSTSFCKVLSRDTANKNPFADRGLDKFYALLADLEEKKQKIYTQKGSEDISFVRFVYTSDDSVKPIVVKVKEKKQPEINGRSLIEQKSFKSDASDKTGTPPASPKNGMYRRCNGGFKVEDLRRPRFYLVAMVVMILVFLVVYGRSFAIFCTSIGWYLAPAIAGGSFSSERKVVHSAAPSSPKILPSLLHDNNIMYKL